MKTVGNILWFLFGGLIGGLSWVLAGCLWCVTIVGIPVGLQCFKFASLAFFPFGKEVVYGGGGFSLLVNILWLLLSGSLRNRSARSLAISSVATISSSCIRLSTSSLSFNSTV